MPDLPKRRSVRDLQAEYDSGNRKPLEDLARAWIGIKELPSDDERSFFVLGGYHGEPFHYRKAVDALSKEDIYTYWGGWCNHGNVLFPLWHRMYVYMLEKALQSIVPGVMMPFWDETSEKCLRNGIPSILTQETFPLDGAEVPNPFRSFVLPKAVSDDLPGDDQIYVKPAGYETVRYPLSGLVGTEAARKATEQHNARFPDPATQTRLLNQNVVAWLKGNDPTAKDPNPTRNGIYAKFQNCLHAPNYTVFSNTTSAQEWNRLFPGAVVTSLESPHNDIHLSVGGFDVPGQGPESGQIAEANGDMGENNTAAMDPIFFFHHCNIDRMFWLWQIKHNQTDVLHVKEGFPGTSSSDSQGPTPGVAPGTPLNLETPLNPFRKVDPLTKGDGPAYTSLDCINIEAQLGFTYGPGSLDGEQEVAAAPVKNPVHPHTKKLTVSGIDRALFQGSFVITAFATVPNPDEGGSTEIYLGHHSVLSRRNVIRCANCLTHLEVVAHFPLDTIPADRADQATFRIASQHRGRGVPPGPGLRAAPAELPEELEVRLTVTD